LARLLGPADPRDTVWVDVGCGTGLHFAAVRTRGYRIIGLDLSADQLRVAAACNPWRSCRLRHPRQVRRFRGHAVAGQPRHPTVVDGPSAQATHDHSHEFPAAASTDASEGVVRGMTVRRVVEAQSQELNTFSPTLAGRHEWISTRSPFPVQRSRRR
jgi:SAM-dependent methyltransferase